MKKTALIVLLFFGMWRNAYTQFLSAYGVAGGITYGKEFWYNSGGIGEGRILRYNGAILAEFFHHPVYRWRVEVMYNQMGGALAAGEVLTNYLSLNNYLKIQKDCNWFLPYILIGPRIEYLLDASGPYPETISNFNVLHITAAAGIGAEVIWDYNPVPFIEAFYHIDIMHTENNYVYGPILLGSIDYRGYEFRIGVKWKIENKLNKCPRVINPNGT
jgi:hypothetical protein